MSKNRIDYTRAMRRRRKGGLGEPKSDGLDRSSPDTIACLTDAWITHMQERNYAAHTIKQYRAAMRSFGQWAEERGLVCIELLKHAQLELYQRSLYNYRQKDGKPLSTVTQRARLGALQQFFAYLCKQGVLGANPAADLELPRKPHRKLPRGLSRDELMALLQVPDTSDPLGIRDRAILETFYATGARRAELVAFDMADLDQAGGTLHIRAGKGGKSRLVPVGQEAMHWLRRYLVETRPKLLVSPSEQALFISGYGDRLSVPYLGNWVSATVKAAGIHKRGGCHLLRHSCATHMLENGADVRVIQQLLGHARLDTTSIYTEVAISHLKEVYGRTHPSAG